MTKAELIDAVTKSDKTPENITKKVVADVFDVIFEEIAQAIVRDGKFSVPGFGTFSKRERGERQGVNPKTKERITIPASVTVGFKPARDLKSTVSK